MYLITLHILTLKIHNMLENIYYLFFEILFKDYNFIIMLFIILYLFLYFICNSLLIKIYINKSNYLKVVIMYIMKF